MNYKRLTKERLSLNDNKGRKPLPIATSCFLPTLSIKKERRYVTKIIFITNLELPIPAFEMINKAISIV